MEINRIRQFMVVANCANLRKAAEILHISPSGLSKSMDVFEEELNGGPLFKREGRGIVLSEWGREMMQRAPTFLEAAEQFSGKSRLQKSSVLNLVTFESFSTYFLGELCEKYLVNVPLILHEFAPGRIESTVANGDADLGISYEPIPLSGIDFLKVTNIKMGIFGRRDIFSNLDLSELPFAAPVTPIQGTPTGVKGLDGWPDNKISRKVQYRVDMMESALELARRGLAVCFLPEFIARLHNQHYKIGFHLLSISIPHKISVSRSIYLIKRTSSEENRYTKIVSKALRQICRMEPDSATGA